MYFDRYLKSWTAQLYEEPALNLAYAGFRKRSLRGFLSGRVWYGRHIDHYPWATGRRRGGRRAAKAFDWRTLAAAGHHDQSDPRSQMCSVTNGSGQGGWSSTSTTTEEEHYQSQQDDREKKSKDDVEDERRLSWCRRLITDDAAHVHIFTTQVQQIHAHRLQLLH